MLEDIIEWFNHEYIKWFSTSMTDSKESHHSNVLLTLFSLTISSMKVPCLQTSYYGETLHAQLGLDSLIIPHRWSSLFITWPDFIIAIWLAFGRFIFLKACHGLPPIPDTIIITKCCIAQRMAQLLGCQSKRTAVEKEICKTFSYCLVGTCTLEITLSFQWLHYHQHPTD